MMVMARELRLSIVSEQDPPAPVSVAVFTRSLEALRLATCHAGEILAGQELERTRGRFAGDIVRACELVIADLQAASATAVLKLPTVEQPHLFEEPGVSEALGDLGERSLDLVMGLGEALTDGSDPERLEDLLGGATPKQRSRILNNFIDLSPPDYERVKVEVAETQPRGRSLLLVPEVRDRVQTLTNPPEAPGIETQERLVIGRLIELRVKDRVHFCIEHGSDEFICPYDEDFMELLKENLGTVLALRGLFRVRPHEDDDDELRNLVNMIDVEVVTADPLVVARVEWSDRVLTLPEPLEVPLDTSADVFAFASPELGIWAYGETRAEAEDSFAEQLFWVWDNYAQRDDQELTPEAQVLKAKVREVMCEEEAA